MLAAAYARFLTAADMRDLPGSPGTHVSYEVTGDPADPMTATTPRHLRAARNGNRTSNGAGHRTLCRSAARCTASLAYRTHPGRREQADAVPLSCDAFVALLIFAPDATNAGRFEDYARLMYPEYARRHLPTWIIGPAAGPGPTDPADILQVWPTRKPIQRLTPGQFNPRIRRLAARHCR